MAGQGDQASRDPLWYKDAIIYELHVKTFHDGNADGIGDFRGLIEKLDYLQELGTTAIWLLPFYPSPLRDDGYDIADYFNVNPHFGTLKDFEAFLKAAHERNLRVITELVINHTSDQNPWFQKSRRTAPGSPEREMYVWSDTPERYKGARIIFKDFETSNWSWDPVAKAYYWHRFYSHQPDLNFDNPAVHEAVQKVLDFWLNLGVDGLRLDAVPYLYEREGTNCENLPETHAYLKKLRRHLDAKYLDRMLLAEANQWPEDAVAYFGEGDESHMNFHFPLMPRMFMSLQMEDRFPIMDVLEQTPAIPETCQWAMFLRNHDELTLEMVTDEERDYMWRVYANDPTARINLGIRRRLAPLLANNRRKIELLNILLLSMPGTPVIYYGDEIGMGDNIYLGDRNGCRTPMQWSADRNAGFSKANPQQLHLPIIIDPEYHYEAINVETQEKNLSSLLWWMRRAIAIRKSYKAFSRGSLEFLLPENPKVLAFIRHYEDEIILVVVNLSRFAQPAAIDLSRFAGYSLVEVVSQNAFPPIKETPYPITLGPHAYYWFALKPQRQEVTTPGERPVPVITAPPELTLSKEVRTRLERDVMPGFLRSCRWFGAKARTIRNVRIAEQVPVSDGADASQFWFVEVDYLEGASETYAVPVRLALGDQGDEILRRAPQAVIARLGGEQTAVLHDAIFDEAFRDRLFQLVTRQECLNGRGGELCGISGSWLAGQQTGASSPMSSQVLTAEQSNSSMLFDNRYFVKLYRKLEDGVNPDVEITSFLTERRGFAYVPAFGGAVEYRRERREPTVVCLVQGAVQNEGNAWEMTLDAVERFFERVLARKSDLLAKVAGAAPGALLEELIGGIYPERAQLLGRRTAELHLALASDSEDPAFAPEPFNSMTQRSVYQTMRASVRRVMALLQKKVASLPETLRADAEAVLAAEPQILALQQRILELKSSISRIRIHGDYHLGQALYTGKDFVILDFEGEPARPLSERKLKRSALRDVTGMMRSFQYAAYSALWQKAMRAEDIPFLETWADRWYRALSATFLQSYLMSASEAPFIPSDAGELQLLLKAYLLDKAVYEIGYELNNRPTWVVIPVRGIQDILQNDEPPAK